jgi:glycosyltransferase involved in cell wall biosynthesis
MQHLPKCSRSLGLTRQRLRELPAQHRLFRNMQRSVNIIGWDNGGGLTRDIELLREVLTRAGCAVYLNRKYLSVPCSPISSRIRNRLHVSRFGRIAVARAGAAPPFALNIHLQEIQLGYCWLARRNVLIPNQEWFNPLWIPHLSAMSEVWTKSHIAHRLFSQFDCPARFVSWTSSDCRVDGLASRKKSRVALHVAGASTCKGTDAVLDVWSRHPEWPILKVLRRTHDYRGWPLNWRERALSSNIELITDRIDESSLRRFQNDSMFYLCPSEAEGFGHIVLEGLSVGGIVITTDAPPMNELVTAESGILVSVERSEPMGMGERYLISQGDLESKICRALAMSEMEHKMCGNAARERFETIDRTFRMRIDECIGAVL